MNTRLVRLALGAGTALLMVLFVPGRASAATPAPTVAFHLADPRLDEASGIGVGLRSPGALYVQNDSGDSARFFALDAGTGRTLAVYDVPDASNVDWEDLAVARDSAGTPSVWLGDIGDNNADRTQIQLYRVDEPAVPMNGSGAAVATAAPQVWRLRYPDGAHDAESLAVSPSGAAFIVTKSVIGQSGVYAVPAQPGPGVQTMTEVAHLAFSPTGTPDPFSVIGEITATGAAWAPSSAGVSLFTVRTYSDAYFWSVPGGDLARALSVAPVRVALPEQPQGEGITVDGSAVLIDSEHAGSAVYRVPLPAAVLALAGAASPASSSAASAPSSAAAPSSSGSSSSAGSSSAPAPSPSPSPSGSSSGDTGRKSAFGIVALLLVAGTWWLSTEYRRRTRAARLRRMDEA